MNIPVFACWRLWSARHLILCLGLAFVLGIPYGIEVYAGSADDGQRFSPSPSSSAYGHRYSQSILRGVRLSDVYTFNDTETTLFGPAYANVWTSPPNFLQCMPPSGREFSYALCYYSGPDAPTGNNTDNPSLPCALSPDGVVANCSCYEISTGVVSPKLPYFVDIHAISNLNIYQDTVETCGEEGEKCADTGRIPPVCEAINTNLLVPGADLISVFSPLYLPDYVSPGDGNSTECRRKDAGTYAGCMTAPCYRTGKKDSNGQDIVECKCPLYDGPYQIGQANQSCNANDPPPGITSLRSDHRVNNRDTHGNNHRDKKRHTRGDNVWSAAFNPAGGPIEIPTGTCIPDVPGDKGCDLFDPEKDYGKIIEPGGALCTQVCADYGGSNGNDPNDPNMQVGYSCDATLCTTVGIGQEGNPNFPPARSVQTELLNQACSGIQDINGLTNIGLVEALAECSCCASQVCGCGNINQQTNEAIIILNGEQGAAGIETQCDLNQTLCGSNP